MISSRTGLPHKRRQWQEAMVSRMYGKQTDCPPSLQNVLGGTPWQSYFLVLVQNRLYRSVSKSSTTSGSSFLFCWSWASRFRNRALRSSGDRVSRSRGICMGRGRGYVHTTGESKNDWGRHLYLFYLCLLSCVGLLVIDFVLFWREMYFCSFSLDLGYACLRLSLNY